MEAAAAASTMRAVLDNAPDSIVAIDHRGRITMFNPSAEVMFGYRQEQVLGRDVALLMPEPFATNHPGYLADYLRTRKGTIIGVGREVEGLRSDGERFPLWLRVGVVDGPNPSFIGILRDVTAQKRHESVLRAAREAAEQAARTKSEFLANMSHEIRTPLTAILGITELLLEDALAEPVSGQVSVIHENGRHLLHLVNDILDLAKSEAGQLSVRRLPTSVSEEIRRCVRQIAPAAARKGLVLEVDTDPALAPWISSDPMRLRQILLNLCGNAIKFTNEGTVALRVRLGRDDRGEVMHLDVEDSGRGMAPEDVVHLFQPFTQVGTCERRDQGGTGLGLTISRRLARLMGGELTVLRTDPGSGTVMRLSLPVRRCGAPARRVEQGRPMDLTGRRILIAEDTEAIGHLLQQILRKVGAESVVVEDGGKALAAVDDALDRGTPFDVIVMDMQMPELNGFEAAARLRERGCRTPILALSASVLEEDKHRALAAGCTAFLGKPVDRTRMLHLLAGWCSGDS